MRPVSLHRSSPPACGRVTREGHQASGQRHHAGPPEVKGWQSGLMEGVHSRRLCKFDVSAEHTRACTHTHTHTHTHTRTHTHAHTHVHTRTHARTHTCTHTRMHVHTHMILRYTPMILIVNIHFPLISYVIMSHSCKSANLNEHFHESVASQFHWIVRLYDCHMTST